MPFLGSDGSMGIYILFCNYTSSLACPLFDLIILELCFFYDRFHIVHTAVPYFKIIPVKQFSIFMLRREMFIYHVKKNFPTLVETFAENGGLNQVTFLFLFFDLRLVLSLLIPSNVIFV